MHCNWIILDTLFFLLLFVVAANYHVLFFLFSLTFHITCLHIIIIAMKRWRMNSTQIRKETGVK